MGAGQSGGVEIGGSSMGYQVLRVYPDSPGSRAGLRAYFDFIVGIGQTRFNKEDGSLREILKASVDQKIKMFVYNTRTKQVREVDIIPTTSWGGSGLLGVSIKHSSFDKADERVWHVIEVDPGSPAQQAGFKAGNDYVIGSDSILQENDDLYNLIEAHEGKALKLFVYNVETDNCREVICHPNSKWGGRGYLGCEFGHGLLHRMPYNETPTGGDSKKSSLPSKIQLPSAVSQLPIDNNPPSQPNNLLQHQAAILNRTATQPGQQLFQQALFSNQTSSQAQQPPSQDLFSKPVEKQTLPPPPQAPQTFAQLASAQFQTQQYQQQTAQIQQQQQLLEQQRQQLEAQKRQMDQLAGNQPPATTTPKPFEPISTNGLPYSSDQNPQSHNYQQGPPLSPPPPQAPHQHQQPQQQQQQYTPPSQQSPPPPQMSPPPLAPPTPSASQPSPPSQPPSQYQNQQYMAQSSPYQQYPYGGMQTQSTDQHQMASAYGNSSESSQSSLPPSVQSLPPPPLMYPPPPQAPSAQQQQQQPQQQATNQPPQTQPHLPLPPFPAQQQQQQSTTMFANQM